MGKVVHNTHWGLKPNFDSIPEILKKQHRWVNWRAKRKGNGKIAKQPMRPDGRMASSRDRRTWTSFERVKAAYEDQENRFDGIGFVLTDVAVDLTVLDLDKAYNPIDGPEDWAQEIIDAADSYTEVSPSDRGIRIFVFGDAGAFTNNSQGLEVYTSSESTRYLTVTGHVLQGRDTINPAHGDRLARVLDQYRPASREGEVVGDPVSDTPEQIQEILNQLFEKDPEMEHYDPWLQVGMALHHQFDGAWQGCDIWREASSRLANYDPTEMEAKWDSFGKNGGRAVTLRTVFERAKDVGVNIRPKEPPVTAADFPDLDEEDRIDEVPELHPAGHTLEDLSTEPPPSQIVEDLLARSQVSQITGEPGAGKTFVAMELAYGVATGEPVFGLRTVPGPVLYLAYEGKSAMAQRVRAWKAKGRKLPSNFFVYGGEDSVPLTDTKEWRKWVLPLLKEHKPFLLIIDTFAAALPGVSTSDEERMGAVTRTLRNLADKRRCHVMTIHHPPKGGAITGQKSRGSGVIEGDLDSQIYVEKTAGTARKWSVTKQRSLGSYGLENQFILKSISTGMASQWGEERAPYLDTDISVEDSYDPRYLAFEQVLDAAIRDRGNTGIDGKAYLRIKAAWLKDCGVNTDSGQKELSKGLKLHLQGRGYEVREAGNYKVEFVGPREVCDVSD